MTHMSKEKFITDILDMVIYGGDTVVAKLLLNDFFESNVCIPKGENRHPYADVLHEWVEGSAMESSFNNGEWLDYDISAKEAFQLKYRIKPPEPIYEWQWISSENGKRLRIDEYMTREEGMEFSNKSLSPWYPDEETKRVRQ